MIKRSVGSPTFTLASFMPDSLYMMVASDMSKSRWPTRFMVTHRLILPLPRPLAHALVMFGSQITPSSRRSKTNTEHGGHGVGKRDVVIGGLLGEQEEDGPLLRVHTERGRR